MSDTPINEVVSKSVEMFESLGKLLTKCSLELRDLKHKVMQYDAKVKTLEGHIMERKSEIKELEEAIRLKRIEVSGSFNNVRDSLTSREEVLIKRMAELEVREQQVKSRASEVEGLMVKAEKVIGRSAPAPVAPIAPAVSEVVAPVADTEISAPVVAKRSPGRPKKGALVSA